MNIRQLISRHPLVTDQIEPRELEVILSELQKVLAEGVNGDVVEFGCFKGTTSLFIQRLLVSEPRAFHVYDSFEGLPEKTSHDSSPAGLSFKKGQLLAKKTDFLSNFRRANLMPPIIHKGWFSELQPHDMPNHIAFAFLDGDYYESIRSSFKLIWPRLVPGAVIIVDDYHNEALPGVEKAVNEWLKLHAFQQIRIQASLAVIRM